MADRLVVVPTDPIDAYERAGYTYLERYFNPAGFFREVFALSPREHGTRRAYGMTIRRVPAERFTSALREIRPQVVRAYGGHWPCDLVCNHRLKDVPVVVSVHDPSPEAVHPSVRYADMVICTSEAVRRRVLSMGVSASRTRVLPNRVDLSIFQPVRDEEKLRAVRERFPGGKLILHVGRKSKAKNIETVVKALAYLPKEYVAIFVGRGRCDPNSAPAMRRSFCADREVCASYSEIAEAVGVSERCYCVPSVPNRELPVWYSMSDCMCTPSLWEGFGIVFIEAAACAAPIVTSDIAPMNEYLRHDESACLVREYQDPKALAAAIERACEDGEYRARLSGGAHEAAKPFAMEVVDAQEVALYQEAIAMGGPTLARRVQVCALQLADAARTSRLASIPRRWVGAAVRRLGAVLPHLLAVVTA